jgi:ABC-type lipoprotein export system ATPase subunit
MDPDPSNQPWLPSGYEASDIEYRDCRPIRISIRNRWTRENIRGWPGQALRSVTFGAVQEEFVAITGPSGCGKTAAPNAGRALNRPTAGTLLFRGNSILNLPDPSIYRSIAFIFQAYHLLPTSTALENVQIPMKLGILTICT